MKTCTWTEESDWEMPDLWQTECGESYYFEVSDLMDEDCRIKFCPFCGKLIKPVPYIEEESEDDN